MKFLIFITLICAFVAFGQAAIGWGTYEDPEHPDKCVIDGKILSLDEKDQDPNGCGIRICHPKSLVQFISCGVVVPPPGYKLADPIPSQPYPDCCDRAFIPIN